MTYFKNCSTQEELKKEYRRLSLILHPDTGGDEEEFKIMSNRYEYLKKNLDIRVTRTSNKAVSKIDKEMIKHAYKKFFKDFFTEEELEDLMNRFY